MTMTVGLQIEALDTLMFRDGLPFIQSDSRAAEARSVFPPAPPSLVGAVRMMLARQRGFDGGRGWPTAELGDGVNWRTSGQLGPLSFSAPMVLKEGNPLFPAPLFLARGESEEGLDSRRKVQEKFEIVRLRPGTSRQCDLGQKVRLPEPENSIPGLKLLDDHWLGTDAMAKVLAGEGISCGDVTKTSKLWDRETRVGIARDSDARVVRTGFLYLSSHIRPRPHISLGVNVRGLTRLPDPATQALASDHRMAAFHPLEQPLMLPKRPPDFPNGTYFVVLLSPAILDALPGPGEQLDTLPGTVVSACLGKPAGIGGWDSLRRIPIPMVQAVPAGSVWFLKASPRDKIGAKHGSHIGRATEWGFGQILVGRWNDQHDVRKKPSRRR